MSTFFVNYLFSVITSKDSIEYLVVVHCNGREFSLSFLGEKWEHLAPALGIPYFLYTITIFTLYHYYVLPSN